MTRTRTCLNRSCFQFELQVGGALERTSNKVWLRIPFEFDATLHSHWVPTVSFQSKANRVICKLPLHKLEIVLYLFECIFLPQYKFIYSWLNVCNLRIKKFLASLINLFEIYNRYLRTELCVDYL